MMVLLTESKSRFYTGRAIHIHFLVRKDFEIADNGCVVGFNSFLFNCLSKQC
jgi:hypothetical protein